MTLTKLTTGLAITIALAAAPSWAAGSKCDSTISKAIGKKVACRCGVYAKGQLKGAEPDGAKLAKCGTKFLATCNKAQSKGGCSAHAESCSAIEAEADAASTGLCAGSVAPAFTD